MVATPRSPRPFTAAYATLLDNAGQPDGVVTADSDGAIQCRILMRFGTKAQIDVIVLQVGESAWTTDTHELRVGDGSTSGGLTVGTSSLCSVSVSATGTAAQNGAALVAAYALAKLLTPQGAAISITNRADIRLAEGIYDISATGLSMDTAGIDIIGAGSYYTTIVTAATGRIVVTLGASDYRFRGLRITSSDATVMLTMSTTGTYTVIWEDVWFNTNDSTKSCTSVANLITIAGRLRNVRTEGQRLLGNATSITISALIEDCVAGNNSFASGTSVGTVGSLTGGIYRTKMFGTACFVTVNCLMRDCDWYDRIRKVGSSAEIYYTTVRASLGTGGPLSIENNGVAVNAKIGHCTLNGDIGNGVTNLLGTNAAACNTVDTDIV